MSPREYEEAAQANAKALNRLIWKWVVGLPVSIILLIITWTVVYGVASAPRLYREMRAAEQRAAVAEKQRLREIANPCLKLEGIPKIDCEVLAEINQRVLHKRLGITP